MLFTNRKFYHLEIETLGIDNISFVLFKISTISYMSHKIFMHLTF